MTTRTDPHSPARFKPSDYTFAFAYAGAHQLNGWPIPPFNMDMAIAAMRNGERVRIPMADGSPRGTLHCDVCGAHFVYGEAWRHEPSGKLVFLGNTCALKYEMCGDSREYERGLAEHRGRVTRRLMRLAKIAEARRFLKANPELRAALTTRHRITRDLGRKLTAWGSLTDGQVALALKLAREARERAAAAPEPEWTAIPAGLGRISVEGRILATKETDGFGYNQVAYKMLVHAEIAGKPVKLWGTIPEALFDALQAAQDGSCGERGLLAGLKGKRVAFQAKVEPSRNDPKFGIFSRPTEATLLDAGANRA